MARRLLASALALSLIITSPGVFSYQLFAQTVGGMAPVERVSLGGGASGSSLNGALSGPRLLAGPFQPAQLKGAVLPGSNRPAVSVKAQAAALTAPVPMASPAPVEAPAGRPAEIPALDKTAAPQAPAEKSVLRSIAEVFLPFAKKPEAAAVSRKVFDGGQVGFILPVDAAAAAAPSPLGGLLAKARSLPSSGAAAVPAAPSAQPKAQERSKIVKFGVPVLLAAGAVALFHASLLNVVVLSSALLMSILIHESAHLWGLRRYGDDTPARAGRDSLNPFRNIHAVGTLLLPAASLFISSLAGFPMLFGWAKPVPVDFNNIKDPKKVARVAAMGPASNIALAALAGAALLLTPAGALGGTAVIFLQTLMKVNLLLTAFNMIPLPFLDGGKVLISMLPKSLYARWITNPVIPNSYQSIFQRIYEGPANILSKIHVHSLEKVNALTTILSTVSFIAISAALFTTLHIPLLFLALPCSYDYWCIREKVRSEAAVQDLMQIMGQWGAVIAQVAEDLGVKSEVSAYEAEHALKNALETAIDELMSKEEFKALSDEDKLKELMRVYPDYAAKFFKDKVMTEDDEATIRKVLADQRNDPYYEKVQEWVKKHDVFKKWGSPHQREKLKESIREADKTHKHGGGSMVGPKLMSLAGPALMIGASFLMPALSGLGVTGMLGSLNGVGPDDKVRAMRGSTEAPPEVFWVHFAPGVNVIEADRILARHLTGHAVTRKPVGNKLNIKVGAVDQAAALAAVEGLKAESRVTYIAVHRAILESMPAPGTPATPAAQLALPPPVSEPAPAPAAEPVAEPAPAAEPIVEAVPAVPVQPAVKGIPADFDPARGILVQFQEGADEASMRAYAERKGLKLTDAEFRGGAGLALLEAAQGTDIAWIISTLRDEADASVVSVSPLKETEVKPAESPAPEPVVETKVEEKPAAPAKPVRRDTQAEWQNFLNSRVLMDGKSTLTPKQVQLLIRFLRPVSGKPDAPVHPVIAVNDILQDIIPVLLSPRGGRNSVFLLGAAGVGKTAIAEGLAQLSEEVQNGGPQYLDLARLKGRWIVDFNIDEILSPGKDEDPMELFKGVMQLVTLLNDANPQRGNEVILLFDEVHKLFMDPVGRKIANYLKGPLRDGRVSMLATTTEKEFKEFIEKDDAFMERSRVRRIEEPGVEKTLEMLRGIKPFLEALHNTVFPDETLVSTARLTHQFVKEHANPRKSVNTLKDAAELARPDTLRLLIALEIRETWRKLALALKEAQVALAEKGIPSTIALAPELYNRIAALSQEAVRLYAEKDGVKDGVSLTTPEIVKRVISKWTGISAGQLNSGEEDSSRYVNMEKEMAKRVINQDRILLALANAIRRNKAGISIGEGPMAKFLMVGPTGTGKTYTAKELARFLFKDPEAMIRMDMSEYQQEHEVARLIGSPPGYVGHGTGGQLTEAVRKKPYSVVLFDEIEKAHPKVWDILLQILDDGRLTDGEGRTVDFKNTVILMSSNAGMSAVDGEKFTRLLEQAATPEEKAKIEAAWDAEIAAAIKEGIMQRFRPEFINRLDEDPKSKNKWVTFNRLRAEDVGAIAKIQLSKFQTQLKDRHDADLVVSDEVYDFLRAEGFSPLYGARPMNGAIEKLIVDPLAQWILGQMASGRKDIRGSLITVGAAEGKISFAFSERPPAVVERVTVAGTSEMLTRKLMEYLEAPGAEPTETLFDSFLKEAVPVPAAPSPAKAQAFNPETPLTMGEKAAVTVAQHNNPKAKDDNLRYASKQIVDTAGETQWAENVKALLQVEPGAVGTGWLKPFIRAVKEGAMKAGVEKPVEMVSQVGQDRIRILLHSGHQMSEQEKAVFASHFTGVAPKSFADAQAKADNLNLTSAMVWDHAVWDLYRRLLDVPGARTGYATGRNARGGEGTDYWIDIPKDAPSQETASSEAAPEKTPHQSRLDGKSRELLLRLITQDAVAQHEQDGPAVKISAATGFSTLAGPEEIRFARQSIRDRNWTSHSADNETVMKEWPLALTATQLMERFGAPSDIPTMETLARKVTSRYHATMPLHAAFVDALAALYVRAGLPETRKALGRAESNEDLKAAAMRALGRLGAIEDAAAVKDEPEALLALYDRVAPEKLQEMLEDHWPPLRKANGSYDFSAWNTYSEKERILVLKLAGRGSAKPAKDLAILGALLASKSGGDKEAYAAAQAWADIAARENMTKNLPSQLERYMNAHAMTNWNGTETWGALLAMVYALYQTGGAENLDMLSDILAKDPNSMQSVYEQVYFSSPWAWAKTVVRSGMFSAYSQPRGDKPSKLMEMLASKKPMEAAAAVYAIVLTQAGEGPAAPSAKPAVDAPELPGLSAPPPSGGSSGFTHPHARMFEDRFGGPF